MMRYYARRGLFGISEYPTIGGSVDDSRIIPSKYNPRVRFPPELSSSAVQEKTRLKKKTCETYPANYTNE